MNDKPMFWTVFKADLLFTLCSVTVSILVTLAIAFWRKRKRKKALASPAPKHEGPKMIMFGGEMPKPEHCPLCGRDWPLPGPVPPPPAPPAPPAI